MRKISAISLIALITLLSYSSCQDDFGGLNTSKPSDVVMFSTQLENPGNAPLTRSVGDSVLMEVSDWLDEASLTLSDDSCKDITRSTPVTALIGSAGIYGYVYDDKVSAESRVFTNEKFNFDGEDLVPETPYAWKRLENLNKAKAWFCSYAPYEETGSMLIIPTIYPADETGKPGVTYSVPDTPAEQIDFLYASSSEITFDIPNGVHKQKIPFTYRHALTAIQFRMGFACKVKSVSIQHVKNEGTFTFANGWETATLTGDATYTFDFGAGQDFAENAFVVDGDNTLMLLPQEFDAESTAKVVLVYDDGGSEKTISASLANSSWERGKKIVYTLYDQQVTASYIYFDLAAGGVTINANTYSGKIYVGGAATTVSGTHKAANKYYVYQSTGATEGTNDKDNTGYPDAEHKNPEDIRIPDYPNIVVDGKDWGDYITDNEDLIGIISNWKTGTEAAGRTSTKNKISISGTTTYNVILDNLWINHYAEDVTKSYTIASAGNTGTTEGDIMISGVGPASKYNIMLKGDNRLYHIHYDNNNNNTTSYLRFTSIEGNGSNVGTLTATSERPVDRLPEGMAVIGTNDGGDHSYGIVFDGGTVFVSDPLMYTNFIESGGIEGVMNDDHYVTCNIGGGGNGGSSVYINGGRLTSLAHSTGSAIGGGGGHISAGGAGTIAITGGNVYAYSYGVFSKSAKKFVPITTIGGGGSVNAAGASGTVTISGGYVYAQSRGGAALGGSCSPTNAGGNGTIKITGGTVIAKSVGGNCLDLNSNEVTIYPGTAIGGGNGSTGGTATVTISGGIVRTGSVGGGKPVSGNNIGNATIIITGGDISGQFIMAKAGSANPSFTMSGGTLHNSSTTDTDYLKAINPATGNVYEGGAVHLEQGTCNINGGTISKCAAALGGAIYIEGGKFTMTAGTLEDNMASDNGGAVYVSGGDVEVRGGSIIRNYVADGNGGGVFVTGGSFSMPAGSSGQLSYNTANSKNAKTAGSGGGIYIASTTNDVTANLISGSITYNTADHDGGGMCVDMSGGSKKATITIGTVGGTPASPKIDHNSAALSGGGMCVLGANSDITINSGTIKGNVSAFVENEDIRNDGGTVTLVGTTANCDVKYNTVIFHTNYEDKDAAQNKTAEQRIVTNTNSKLAPPVDPSQPTDPWFYEWHEFVRWNTKRDGSGTDYAPGATMKISADLHLYAIWRSTN